MIVKRLILAEIEVDAPEDDEAAAVAEADGKLDNFRESVLPGAHFGIHLSKAQAADVYAFTASGNRSDPRPIVSPSSSLV